MIGRVGSNYKVVNEGDRIGGCKGKCEVGGGGGA